MDLEKSSAVINHNHSEEVKRPCNSQNFLLSPICIVQVFCVKSGCFVCYKVVCIPLIPSQKNKSWRNQLNSRLIPVMV